MSASGNSGSVRRHDGTGRSGPPNGGQDQNHNRPEILPLWPVDDELRVHIDRARDADKRKMIQNQLIILIHAAKCQKRAENNDGQVNF